MTRGGKTVRILAVVAVLTVSAAFAAYAMELHRMVLWQVVRACVADYKLTGTPFPCLEVNLSGGEERGDVVLRPPFWMTRSSPRRGGLLELRTRSCSRPRRRTISTPLGARACSSRPRTDSAPERDAIALFVNSAVVRTQDQLHIHVGCLVPYARRTLAAAAPKVPMGEWAQIGPVVPHTMFWGYRIPGTELANVNPFRFAAEALARQDEQPGRRDDRGRRGSRRKARINS